MTAPLIDPFARTIDYLRVSVTDRCDFRCVYCMSENMTFLPKKELLTLEELDRMCSAFVRMGVKKLRITGGEPLVRRGIMTFFETMARHLETGALRELTLTTNGSQLEKYAADLAACGVKRINVSLDTLDEEKFARVTRWGRLPQVLRGIDAAQAAGFEPLPVPRRHRSGPCCSGLCHLPAERCRPVVDRNRTAQCRAGCLDGRPHQGTVPGSQAGV